MVLGNPFSSLCRSRPTLRELCGHLCLAGGLPVKVRQDDPGRVPKILTLTGWYGAVFRSYFSFREGIYSIYWVVAILKYFWNFRPDPWGNDPI